MLKGSTILDSPRIVRAKRRILLPLFPRHVGKPEGLLRATVAADLDRYTIQVSEPYHTGQGCRTSASKGSESIALVQMFVNSFEPTIGDTVDHASCYSIFLDMPQGLGATTEVQLKNRIRLVQEIEVIEKPPLRFGCWPVGRRAGLAISGDIDSAWIQCFF